MCAAAARAVELVRADPTLRSRLWRNIETFARGLSALGFDAEPRSAIFPIVLGDPQRAVDASDRLRERGVLAKAIRPPTVPDGSSRLRFAVSAAHTEAQLASALEAIAAVLPGSGR